MDPSKDHMFSVGRGSWVMPSPGLVTTGMVVEVVVVVVVPAYQLGDGDSGDGVIILFKEQASWILSPVAHIANRMHTEHMECAMYMEHMGCTQHAEHTMHIEHATS